MAAFPKTGRSRRLDVVAALFLGGETRAPFFGLGSPPRPHRAIPPAADPPQHGAPRARAPARLRHLHKARRNPLRTPRHHEQDLVPLVHAGRVLAQSSRDQTRIVVGAIFMRGMGEAQSGVGVDVVLVVEGEGVVLAGRGADDLRDVEVEDCEGAGGDGFGVG